jgi:hypothetical protein
VIRLLEGLVDDAGLFPPSWLPMDEALARHRRSDSPMLTGRFLLPADRVVELEAILDGPIDVHLIGDDVVTLPTDDRIAVKAVELRSGTRDDLPCYVEGIAPSELKPHGMLGKLRCGGVRIPSVEEVAAYVTAAARASLPFKGTAGMHAAVRGWESTNGEPHHGYLNLVLAVARSLREDDVVDVLRCDDADALVAEAKELSDDLVVATRWLFHSYGSCDTDRPVHDALELGLV